MRKKNYITETLPIDNFTGLPYYNLPEVTVSASKLPIAKPTDNNINRYAQAVANNQIKLTQIPNTELRNRVRAKPIVDQIRKDRDKTALPIAAATLGLPAAIAGGISSAPTVNAILNNPWVDAGLTAHGLITAPGNIKEGINDFRNKRYISGATNLGMVGLDLFGAGKLGKHLITEKPVGKFLDRTAEAMVRQGAALPDPRLWNYKGMLDYMFKGGKNPDLAYKAGLYSGRHSFNKDLISKELRNKPILDRFFHPYENIRLSDYWIFPHKGDVVDGFFGKIYNSADKEVNEIPDIFKNYIAKNYPDKNIKTFDLGTIYENRPVSREVANSIVENQLFKPYKTPRDPISGKDLVDVGGHNVKLYIDGNNLIDERYDIWKFNGKDLENRYHYGFLSRLAGDFIDWRGNPMIHTWKYITPIKN